MWTNKVKFIIIKNCKKDMRILLCFDVDGTFWTDEEKSEYVCGVIDPLLLQTKIESTGMDQYGIYVVSESPYYPKLSDGSPRFPVVNQEASRGYNLMKVKELFGPSDICIYVDDKAIWKKDAEQAGFMFCDASKFADMMNVRKNVSSTDTIK